MDNKNNINNTNQTQPTVKKINKREQEVIKIVEQNKISEAEKQLAKGISEIEPILQKKPNKKIILTKKQTLKVALIPPLIAFPLLFALLFISSLIALFLWDIDGYVYGGAYDFHFYYIPFITLLSFINPFTILSQILLIRRYKKKNKPFIDAIKSNNEQSKI